MLDNSSNSKLFNRIGTDGPLKYIKYILFNQYPSLKRLSKIII